MDDHDLVLKHIETNGELGIPFLRDPHIFKERSLGVRLGQEFPVIMMRLLPLIDWG